MRIELENVGKIGRARIELDGVTVIAGENSTGKSTVGKMLFSVFKGFYEIEEHIREERLRAIYDVFESGALVPPSDFVRRLLWYKILQMLGELDEYRGNESKIISEFADLHKELFSHPLNKRRGEDLEVKAKKINEYLYMEDEELIKLILKKSLGAEFGKKIGHLNFPMEESRIFIKIKDDTIDIRAQEDGEIEVKHYISLRKEIIYIDDPFVVDNLYDNNSSVFNTLDHRSDLQRKLVRGKGGLENILEELTVQKKMQNILNVMKGVCDGEIVIEPYGNYAYRAEGLQGNLKMINLSTGMKNFVILKQLLQNGSIDENGIVILDEPEIHLHPEWQLKFAEIIVLLQIEFGVHVLLNTHSPYFLNAIEVYTNKYGIGDKCRYYLAEEKNGRVGMEDVTNEVERIYAKLARPLQDLENMGYGDGNTV